MTLSTTSNDKSQLISKEAYKEVHSEQLLLDPPVSLKIRGVSVIWKNLKVTARIKKQNFLQSSTYTRKDLIHNVNGCVLPSTLVGILGASGSGKSTLMTVLANRQSSDLDIQGDIRIDGKKIQMKYIKQISGFVYQDDLFASMLTVSEHLHLAAQLKLDRRITADFRQKLVDNLLSSVGLLKCANRFVGTSHYDNKKMNLSGGEQKRLSVATELITDPSLLFCDEPTTGLDSFSALKLMSIMRNMTTERNTTIICSIHQPSEQIFNLFDYIILLYNGEIAYSGTTQNALRFFQSLGYSYNEDQNPADYLVKSLAIIPGRENETAKLASDICVEFKKSEYVKEINEYIETECKKTNNNYVFPTKVKRISWFYHLYLMTYRNFLSIIRNPSNLGLRLLNKELLAVIIGVCFMGTITMTQEGIQSLIGVTFTIVAENFFPAIYGILDHMPNQMPVFRREYTNNINSPLIFYLSNVFSLLPLFLIDPIIFTIIVYWLAGLRPELLLFLETLIINVLVLNCSAAFGIFVSLLINNFSMVTITSTVTDMIYMIISGIFINFRTVPSFLVWIRYVSWMVYSTEALLILQLQDIHYIACKSDLDLPCLKNGTEVLTQLDFNAANLCKNIFLIFFICIILHTASYCVLSVKLYFQIKR